MKRMPPILSGLLFFTLSIIIFLSLISFSPADIEFLRYPANTNFKNLAGVVGAKIAFVLVFMFGYGSFFLPLPQQQIDQ